MSKEEEEEDVEETQVVSQCKESNLLCPFELLPVLDVPEKNNLDSLLLRRRMNILLVQPQ